MPPAVSAVTTASRLPRFARRPGTVAGEITKRDEAMLRAIAEHRFITSVQIIALICALFPGSSEQQVLRRLRFLFDGQFVTRPRAQIEVYKAGGGSQPMVYALGNRGMDYLAEHFGFRRAAVDWTARARTAVRGEMRHALNTTEFMVRLAIACRERGAIRVLPFEELLSTIAPEKTRARKRPDQWPVTLRWKGKEVVLHPTPDRIFGIRDPERPAGRQTKYLFLENDEGTMPTARRDLDKTSILRKLVAFSATYARDLHTAIFGMNNVRILFVTPGRERIANIQKAYRDHRHLLAPPGLFLFADRRGLIRAGDILEYPWLDAESREHRLLD